MGILAPRTRNDWSGQAHGAMQEGVWVSSESSEKGSVVRLI